jgi:hypothetical protein
MLKHEFEGSFLQGVRDDGTIAPGF